MASTDLLAALRSSITPTGGGAVGFASGLAKADADSASRRAQALAGLMSSLPAGGGGGGGGGYSPPRNAKGVGLTTITAPNGQRVTVAANYAGKFSGLLRDLWNAGYHFKSVGGYNYRNIAGTNTLSKHATGEAIDIDPGANPVVWGNGPAKTYFNPNVVNAIIRKYGLDWGGDWTGGKRDYMHFSTGG